MKTVCKACGGPMKRYAEGGDTEDDPSTSAEPDEPVAGSDDPSAAVPLDDSSPEPITDNSPAPAATKQTALPPKPANMPSAGTVDVIGVKPPPPPPPTAQDLDNEDALYQQDLARGAIKPKTYADLFAEKSTLGKIGSLFGLILSGAGSGLAHQPNALIGMMDKQIDRDLEAQKQSRANTQNFLKLSHEHHMQKHQFDLIDQQTELARQQGLKVPEEAEELKARKNLAYAEADLAGTNAAKNRMMLSVGQHLLDNSNMLPAGPQKDAYIGTYNNVIAPAIQKDVTNRNAQTSAQIQQMRTAADPEGAFQNKQQGLRVLGMDPVANSNEARHYPGLGEASVPLSGGDREQIKDGLTFQDQLNRFMNWAKTHSGDLNPKDRKTGEAMAAGLQGAYRMATHGGVYKAGEQDFISSIIDSEPTKFFNSIRVMPSLGAVKIDSQAQLDQLLRSKGFKGYPGASNVANQTPEASGSKYAEGQRGKDKNGNPVVFKDGSWRRPTSVGKK